ncbi:MAG: acetolactate synthase large subunit [Candidatus Acidiferrales bacterium]
MNGAEAVIRSLVAGGIETCFTNPGTSEMHLVAALDGSTGIRCVLALFEGVAIGAADGYARMTGRPACTLLHLGPGFANGIANLHNANRAHVPMVNLVGQHPAYHLGYDAPLTSDIEAIARPYSAWLRTTQEVRNAGCDTVEAVANARIPPGQIATLIIPADVAWSEGATAPIARAPASAGVPDAQRIEDAAAMLRSGQRTAILIGGNALFEQGLTTAGKIASTTGAKLFAPYPFTRLRHGAGTPMIERVAYVREQAAKQFSEFPQLILVGAAAPVSYFAYQGKRSRQTQPDCNIFTLADASEDGNATLMRLAEALGAENSSFDVAKPDRPLASSGQITLQGLALTIAATLPEEAIVADESMTSGRGILIATQGCSPHDWLACTGGSIGIAMPLAVGAAVACPDRPVLCLTADGSGMYTLQALWTMAREGLHVVTVVFANRAYGVLKREYSNLGIGEAGQRAKALFNIGEPDLDWVALAHGMGVPGTRVTSLEEFAAALTRGFKGEGPSLIEVPL